MKQVTISVIIPTFNGQDFIGEAIDSIVRQSCPVKEIIVVDDGSTDKTEEIVKKQRGNIRFIKQPHQGDPVFGRNTSIRVATGEFIAFLDQDDLWPENKLQTQLNNFNHFPDVEVDVGFTKIVNLNPHKTNASDFGRFKEFDQYFLLSSGLFRKSIFFERIGMFDESMKYHGSDFDWILRAAEQGVLFNLHEEITLIYRIHKHNYSNDPETLRMGIMEVLKKSLIRRKRKGTNSFTTFPELNTTKKREL